MLVIPRTSAAVVVFAGLLARAAAADEPRVGFANLSVDEEASVRAIASLRAALERQGGFVEIADGPARFALEDVVDPQSTVEGEATRRAESRLAQAREAWSAFEFDTALDQVLQAEQLLRSVAPSREVTRLLADAQLLAGLVHMGRQDESRALAAFRLVRRLDPERTTLDRKQYRPQVVAFYDKAVAAADEATASIEITTEPPGATVWIDGRDAGRTPTTLTLDAGDHYVSVTYDGYAARTEKQRLSSDRGTQLALLLSRLPPEVRARSIRAGLLRRGITDADYLRAAEQLADAVSLDALILVRDREGGGAVEAAVYDPRATKLSAWTPVDDPDKVLALLPRAKAVAKIAVPAADPAGELPPALRTGDITRDGGRRPDPPWYRTPWGTGAIIGGAVVVTAMTFLLLAPGSSETTDTNWTFGWGDAATGKWQR